MSILSRWSAPSCRSCDVRLCLIGLLSLSVAACERPGWAKGSPPPAAAAPATVAAPAAVPSGEGVVAWARPMLGRSPREVFPSNGVCIGNADGAHAGEGAKRVVYGWGWDLAAGRPVERVILVDVAYRIVGAGDGRIPRADVNRGHPEYRGAPTGWRAATNLPAGPMDAFGIVDGGGVCPLGHVEG